MFQFIAEELAKGKKIAVATVVLRSGSGPREPGAMMVVAEDASARGTVGGGLLEAGTLEAAKAALHDGKCRLLTFDLNARDLSDGAMVCGGRVDILVDRLDGSNPEHVRIYRKLAEMFRTDACVYLVTSMRTEAGGEVSTGRGLMSADGFDCLDLPERFRDATLIQQAIQAGRSILPGDDGAGCFIQMIPSPKRIFIAGAGHIGQALASICSIAGFQVVVIDDRPAYANAERFPVAVSIKQISRFADALKSFMIGAPDAVVIATHSHLADRDVLAAVLATEAGYIGMIASRRKRDMIYASLVEEGFTPEDFARVHSPAGLNIGAQTPAEIAISVAAELIVLSTGDR